MDQNSGVGKHKALTFLSRGEEKRAHRRRLPDAHRRHFGTNKLHRIVDREPCCNDPARRVNVEGDFLFRIIGLKEQELSDDQRSRYVVDRTNHENDAFAQQPRENVERSLASRRLLNNDRHEVIGIIVYGIAHWDLSSRKQPTPDIRPYANIGARDRMEKRLLAPIRRQRAFSILRSTREPIINRPKKLFLSNAPLLDLGETQNVVDHLFFVKRSP